MDLKISLYIHRKIPVLESLINKLAGFLVCKFSIRTAFFIEHLRWLLLLKKQIYIKKIEEDTFANIDLFYFSNFIFKKNHRFIAEGNPSEKVVVAE